MERQTLRRAFWHGAEPLDRVDHERCRWDVETMRPREGLDEAFQFSPRALRIVERLRQLLNVCLEVIRELQQPATLRRQIMKMEGAFLSGPVFRCPNRQDRAAYNAAFNL